MNDEWLHIKKELTSLVRRAEFSFSPKVFIKSKPNRQRKTMNAVPNHSNQFWKEFRRQSMPSHITKSSFQQKQSQKQSLNQPKRCRSAFYKRMLKSEGGINHLPKSNKIQPKTFVASTVEKVRIVKTKLYKNRQERPHTSSPRYSSNTQDYLDAKKSFSNRRMTLFLQPVKVENIE